MIEMNNNKLTLTIKSGLFYKMKKILGDNKSDALFISHRRTVLSLFRYIEVTVYDGMLIELYALLQLTKQGNVYGISVRYIDSVINELAKETSLKYIHDKKEHIDTPMSLAAVKQNMKFDFMKHQENMLLDYANLRYGLGLRGIILDAATGSGKTFMSLALAEMTSSKLVFIIAPLNTIDPVWKESLESELYRKPQDLMDVRTDKDYKKQRFVLISYESLSKLTKILKKVNYKPFIIVDEIHNFADPKSKRHKELVNIIEYYDPEHLILMSGTPIKGSIREIVTLSSLIDPKLTKHTLKRFMGLYKSTSRTSTDLAKFRYSVSTSTITKDSFELPEKEIIKLSVKLDNSDEYTLKYIKEVLKKYVKERNKYYIAAMQTYTDDYLEIYADVKEYLLSLGDIPKKEFDVYEKNVKIVRINHKNNSLLSIPEIIQDTNTFEKEVIIPSLSSTDKKIFRKAKSVYKYYKLVIIGESLSNVIGKARENAHKDMARIVDIKSLVDDAESKTIVFTKYVSVCEVVMKDMGSIGKNPIGVYGEHTKSLASTVSKFLKDKKINPLVATFQSLSTGVRLTAANTILMIDTPFKAYQFNQTIARTWRIGQDHDVKIFICELDTGDEPNINSRNIDLVSMNNQIVQELTGVDLGGDISDTNVEEYEDENKDIFDRVKYTSKLMVDRKGVI